VSITNGCGHGGKGDEPGVSPGQRRGEDIPSKPESSGGDDIEECDRTTSEMRGSSPKIISRDSRRSENMQTQHRKHTIPIL
jgi:hypothetical protein